MAAGSACASDGSCTFDFFDLAVRLRRAGFFSALASETV